MRTSETSPPRGLMLTAWLRPLEVSEITAVKAAA
jgi:hypothetical protein